MSAKPTKLSIEERVEKVEMVILSFSDLIFPLEWSADIMSLPGPARARAREGMRLSVREDFEEFGKAFLKHYPENFKFEKLHQILGAAISSAEELGEDVPIRDRELLTKFNLGQHVDATFQYCFDDKVYTGTLEWGNFHRYGGSKDNPKFVLDLTIRMSNDGFRYPGMSSHWQIVSSF